MISTFEIIDCILENWKCFKFFWSLHGYYPSILQQIPTTIIFQGIFVKYNLHYYSYYVLIIHTNIYWPFMYLDKILTRDLYLTLNIQVLLMYWATYLPNDHTFVIASFIVWCHFKSTWKTQSEFLFIKEIWILPLATLSQMFSLNRKLILFFSEKIFYHILPSQYA